MSHPVVRAILLSLLAATIAGCGGSKGLILVHQKGAGNLDRALLTAALRDAGVEGDMDITIKQDDRSCQSWKSTAELSGEFTYRGRFFTFSGEGTGERTSEEADGRPACKRAAAEAVRAGIIERLGLEKDEG